jgi:uncharacterized repeat protein (TIGR02543 family)
MFNTLFGDNMKSKIRIFSILICIVLLFTITACVQEDKETYVILFERNGGSIVDSQTIVKGENINSSPITTKEEYTFIGWYDNIDLIGNKMEFPFTPTRNLILYAAWTENGLKPSSESDFQFARNGNNISIIGYIGGKSSVIIPSVINNMPVTTISNGSFNSYCKGVK